MSILIYHITHINNLTSIIQAEGLIAKNYQLEKCNNSVDIAHQGIQDRRSFVRVPCSAGGTLHDYVPFYFAPRSPMLFSINKGNVQGYQDGQQPIIYLVVDAEVIVNHNLPFAFTDGHAVMDYSTFCHDLNRLNELIDWRLMQSKYWFDTNDDPDRKRRRQAEFLIYKFCSWSFIQEIGVINPEIKQQVEDLLRITDERPPVTVYPNWYY